ncbi:MAG: hypothetical protein ABI861_03015 [Panacibacter sp.]
MPVFTNWSAARASSQRVGANIEGTFKMSKESTIGIKRINEWTGFISL